jgi:oligoendopeptidase F
MPEEVQMDWDLTPFFDSFNGKTMRDFKKAIATDTDSLRSRAQILAPLDASNEDEWLSVIVAYEEIETRLGHLSSYMSCLSAADARNEAYATEMAALNLMYAEGAKLDIELLRAVRDASDEIFESLIARNELKGTGFILGKMRTQAKRTMDPDLEVLAADLGVNGIEAWGALYDSVSGKLEFEMVYPDGRSETLPISQRRSLMEHSDRAVRMAAFEGGNKAWESMESVTAAALNAISGTRLTLNKRRGVDHFLDMALHQANISRETLDAMFEAIYSEIELPRNILRYKAKAMGTDNIAWYDLAAALELPDQEEVTWERGTTLVKNAFTRAYPLLGDFLQDTYDKRWIDYAPRQGKRPGAFCTGSPMINESRVYMTYNDTMGDVLTLAHEVGHAFHSYVMRDLRPLARSYPMTLAESASTFGEMILMKGLLADPSFSDATKAFLLNLETSHAATYLMDIPVRYEFEKTMHEERANGELSVSRFKELMVSSQRNVFGDVLRDGGEDPLFWASKLHFYITGVTFYNFPYTFGYLLSRGLFALYEKDGHSFLPRYEEFLRLTGSDTAENVVKRSIGRDISDPDFWREAIGSLGESQARLEAILPAVLDS